MLYVVGTPIGNLKDITLRALETLKAADVILCEDTRHSLKLLSAYEIKKPLIAYHKFNEREAAERVIELLKEGKEIALISDAGMPLISDPGSVLTARLREEGLSYTVIPGTTAFVPALILAGYGAPFLFYGFLPEKNKERQAALRALSTQTATLIFYCAPHDVEKTVKDLYAAFGERNACAVREITKIYEEAEHFTLSQGVKEPKGEYVLIVSGAEEQDEFATLTEKEHIQRYLDEGLSKMDAIKRVAKERGVAKSSLYHYTVEE